MAEKVGQKALVNKIREEESQLKKKTILKVQKIKDDAQRSYQDMIQEKHKKGNS
jgi:hypothetical protein